MLSENTTRYQKLPCKMFPSADSSIEGGKSVKTKETNKNLEDKDSENNTKQDLLPTVSGNRGNTNNSPTMSGKLFASSQDNENLGFCEDNQCNSNNYCENNNSMAPVHNLSGPCVSGGPEMTSTPCSEHQPSSFGGNSDDGKLASRGQLRLDLRGRSNQDSFSANGHPLQKVVTPSPVPTPTHSQAVKMFALSSKCPPLGQDIKPFSGQDWQTDHRASSLDQEDYCQCGVNSMDQQTNRRPVLTSQESVHEQTASLRLYPNGERYLCEGCRNEVAEEVSICQCSLNSSPQSSLEPQRCTAKPTPPQGHQYTQRLGGQHQRDPAKYCAPRQAGMVQGRNSQHTVVNMADHPDQYCDAQNRYNSDRSILESNSEIQKPRNKTICYCCTVQCICVVISMFLCAIFAVGLFYLIINAMPTELPTANPPVANLSQPLMQSLKPEPICVKCNQLRLSADPIDDFTKSLERRPDPKNPDRESEAMCCAHNNKQVQQIFDAILETKTRTVQVSRPQTNYSLPLGGRNELSALLYLNKSTDREGEKPDTTKPQRSNRPEEKMPHIEEVQNVYGWTNVTPSDAGFVRSGIVFDKTRGRLTVTRTGLYYVYTKLAFKPDTHSNGVVFTQKLLTENIKRPGSQELELLRDTQYSPCPHISTTHPCHSSNLAAVVYLRKADELFVKASHGDLLVRDMVSSYFGLFYIDN